MRYAALVDLLRPPIDETQVVLHQDRQGEDAEVHSPLLEKDLHGGSHRAKRSSGYRIQRLDEDIDLRSPRHVEIPALEPRVGLSPGPRSASLDLRVPG